jgi:hypothetical protein
MKSVLVVVFVVGLALPAVAHAYAAFRTPGRVAYCGLSEGEPPISLICWTPGNGYSVSMFARGRASGHSSRPNRGAYQDLAPVLRFAHTWRTGSSFTCTSRSSGLTCRNRAGHGWWLGRNNGHRLF